MTRAEKENWMINLEDVSSQVDAENVKFVCEKYGPNDIDSLSSNDYQEVWNELFQYAVDAND